MKKISIIILTLFLLSIAAVSAADFEFNMEPIRGEIDSGEDAQFLVTIDNEDKSIREFKIYSPDVEWDVPTEIIKAYPETETSYKLVIAPTKYIEPGKIYGVNINLKDVNTEQIVYSDIAQINVKGAGQIVSSYRPSVRMTVDVPSSIDPREPANIKIRLENQNLLDLSDMIIKTTSELSAFETEQEVDLEPLGKKSIDISNSLHPLQEPGEYTVNFGIYRGDEKIEETVKTITISQITPGFKEEQIESKLFFKTYYRKNFTSSSNVEDTQQILIPTSTIRCWFTKTYPESYKIEQEGKKYLALDLNLRPDESREVVIIVNYRSIIYLLLLIFAVVLVYYRYKSTITIRKGISDVNIREGGISELKVTLELTNKDKKAIKNVEVTDYIPNIADIEKEFSEGTLRPSRIFKHKTKGTVLKWEIDELSQGESRLINYNIKSKLSIIGNFQMPRAKVSFKKKRRKLIAYSNQVGVSS